ncbi:MAG: hypothetical protein JRN20_15660 [Nitrososphaerota archaeon]|nr:hypothetical protein [Nitrososphaerota archaeon]
MKRQVTLVLIVVALLVSAGIGYFGSGVLNKTDSCTTLSSLRNVSIPVGFEPTVSYKGEWRVSIATFAAKADNASALTYVCTYVGSGSNTFYVGLANYLGGWNTMVVLAHKLGSNGALSVEASIGNQTSTNSTTQAYGSAVVTVSFYFAN